MNNTLTFNTEKGTHFSFKFSEFNRELYELYEHDGLPKWKQLLYPSIINNFNTVIDLTPEFGLFSINIALAAKQQIKIGLLEENNENSELLKNNFNSNQIENIFFFDRDLNNEVLINEFQDYSNVLIRSTSIEELNTLLNKLKITTEFPSLIIEHLDYHQDYQTLKNQLTQVGYQIYAYCPITRNLVSVSGSDSIDSNSRFESTVMFAFSHHQSHILHEKNILLSNNTYPEQETVDHELWKTVLSQQIYSSQYISEWDENPVKNRTYIELLNYALLAFSKDTKNEIRLNHLLSSYGLLQNLSVHELTFSQLLTAARISGELGYKLECETYLLKLIELFQSGEALDLNEPFLPPSNSYENLPSDDIANWCLASILATYEENRSDSCIEIQENDIQLLEIFINLPYINEHLSKRYEIYKAIHTENNNKPLSNPSLLTEIISEPSAEDEKPDLAILYHLARTGGTLISKCIGCIDDNILLSEIHPLISTSNPLDQASDWFGLFDEIEKEQYKNQLNYINSIRIIQNRASKNGKKLVLRDWSHIDFTAIPFVDRCSYQLRQTEALSPYFNIKQLATVRHPVDSYLSLEKLQIMQEKLTLDHYLKGAKEFALKAKEIGFVRYEDFCSDPKLHLQYICKMINLNYDEVFLERFSEYTKITGETTGGRSRGMSITVPKQREVDHQLSKQFIDNEDYWEILKILEYENYLS